MSDTDTFSPEELAALDPKAEQAQPPAPEPTPDPTPAPVEPPKAPEPVAEAPKPAEEPKPGPKTVPLAELLEERRKRQEFERRIAELTAPKPQEPQIPAFEADPATHLKTRLDQSEEQVRAMIAAQQRQQMEVRLESSYVNDLRRVAATNPSVTEAHDHYVNVLANYIRTEYPGAPDEAVAAAVRQRHANLVYNALATQTSPAEAMISAAKLFGWAPKAPEPEPAPASAPTPAPSLVQQIAAGQQVATNPLAGAGSTPVPELTPATLAAMSEEEVAELPHAKWRKAMGG